MAQPERPAFAPRGRGGFAARGRGGFGGRGGYGNGQSQSFNAGPPVPSRKEVTGENRTAPEGGMRAWGSAPTSDSEAIPLSTKVAAASSVDGSGDAEKKKKKRKGDKGGTGAKANSRLMAEAAEAAALAAAAAEPAAKKRKRDNDESTAASTPAPAPAAAEGSAAPSDKTLKRIKKHMAKLEDKTAAPVPLAQWLASVGANKDKTVERGDILAGVQVTFVDGRWQLSL
jgi:cell growth-regulating nucleolar protein